MLKKNRMIDFSTMLIVFRIQKHICKVPQIITDVPAFIIHVTLLSLYHSFYTSLSKACVLEVVIYSYMEKEIMDGQKVCTI